ncbi:hypothetical protein [Modestobacter sp. SYSU DS0875]
MEPTDLHDRLHRLADRTAPPAQPGLADTVVARHRTQRRQALTLTAVAAAVAAVVVATPLVFDGQPAAPVSAAGPAAATAGAPAAARVDVLSGPTRGALAQDTAFVDGVRRLTWTEADDPNAPTAQVDPPLDSRHVVWVDDVAGARWALVAGQDPEHDDGRLATAWFTGPAGADAAELQPASLLSGIDASTPVALSDAGTGALVVVAAPGDDISLSRRPEVAADGAVDRSFEPVDVSDGVAALVLPPAAGTYDEALRYRVTRDGTAVTTAMPAASRSVGVSAADDVPLTWLRSEPGDRDPVLTGGIDHVLEITGLPPEDLEFTVIWAGEVPASTAETAEVHLLGATLPSGAVHLEALLAAESDDGVVASTWCASDLREAGAPLAEQLFVLHCSAPFLQGTEPVESLVLVGPPVADSARVLDDSGALVTEVPLVDGVAVVPPPADLGSVEFRSRGRSLGSAGALGFDGLESIAATPAGGN